MHQRMSIAKLEPDFLQAVLGLEKTVQATGIDRRYLHLIKLRASQINGCGYCVELHVREALEDGLDPRMLHMVVVWRESSFFDERDRAVLEWTESVTLLAQTGVPDSAWETVRAQFSEKEVAELTMAIATINVWNRMNVSSRTPHKK